MPEPQEACPLEEVVITPELRRRAVRPISAAAEQDSLSVLSNAILTGPDRLLALLVEHAMRLCRAQSAGVSVEDLTVDPPVFRWHAVAGRLQPFLRGTMPRFFSPCGETVARNEPMLMRDPVKHYSYAAALGVPLTEVLLVPFAVAQKPVGTVWVIGHDAGVGFTLEDLRVVQSLSRFAGKAVTALQNSRGPVRGGH
jgi:hypothetical protein